MSAQFYRDFYYEVVESIKEHKITVICGPRKCGKTFCLGQIEMNLSGTEYITFRSMTELKRVQVKDRIVQSIKNSEPVIYLLDEITDMVNPEECLCDIWRAFLNKKDSITRIVITGSQSVAIRYWSRSAFCDAAKIIDVSFLTYSEWLRYKQTTIVSEDTYLDFVLNVRDFYTDFTDVRSYLQGCLDDTIMSNKKSTVLIPGNDFEYLDTEILMTIMYHALISRSNRVSTQKAFSETALLDDIIYYFSNLVPANLQDNIKDVLKNRIFSYSLYDVGIIKDALLLLYNFGLISLTYVSDTIDDFPTILDIPKVLADSDSKYLRTRKQLFEHVNICATYPMFYMALVREVIGGVNIASVHESLLGTIVECHVRALLPSYKCYEYHSLDGRDAEIDYVNPNRKLCIEISVSNKKRSRLHFDDFKGQEFKNVLITNDQAFEGDDGISRIPYYVFIYNNSMNDTGDLSLCENVNVGRAPVLELGEATGYPGCTLNVSGDTVQIYVTSKVSQATALLVSLNLAKRGFDVIAGRLIFFFIMAKEGDNAVLNSSFNSYTFKLSNYQLSIKDNRIRMCVVGPKQRISLPDLSALLGAHEIPNDIIKSVLRFMESAVIGDCEVFNF